MIAQGKISVYGISMLYECPVVQLSKQLYDFHEMKKHLRQDFEKYCKTKLAWWLRYMLLYFPRDSDNVWANRASG
jgi:hypothetical protein